MIERADYVIDWPKSENMEVKLVLVLQQNWLQYNYGTVFKWQNEVRDSCKKDTKETENS
jgi:hypothetical protein